MDGLLLRTPLPPLPIEMGKKYEAFETGLTRSKLTEGQDGSNDASVLHPRRTTVSVLSYSFHEGGICRGALRILQTLTSGPRTLPNVGSASLLNFGGAVASSHLRSNRRVWMTREPTSPTRGDSVRDQGSPPIVAFILPP